MSEPSRSHESEDEEPLPPPTGTLFLCTLYLAALAGMWGAMYLIMLAR
jgi:hypothetical protein